MTSYKTSNITSIPNKETQLSLISHVLLQHVTETQASEAARQIITGMMYGDDKLSEWITVTRAVIQHRISNFKTFGIEWESLDSRDIIKCVIVALCCGRVDNF